MEADQGSQVQRVGLGGCASNRWVVIENRTTYNKQRESLHLDNKQPSIQSTESGPARLYSVQVVIEKRTNLVGRLP